MRRKEKELLDKESIKAIIKECSVCRLGLSVNDNPYIVPVSFGFDGLSIYFHTAIEGKKIEYIQANNKVCFEFEHKVQLAPDQKDPCKWTFSFQTVIGYGKIHELTEKDQKINGLSHIMAQYSKRKWVFNEEILKMIRLWKISIENMTAKQSIETQPS
ncbi:MAG: pyridoxamine 5'-phosphate oxidase family protein [Deltaproteobacteria bacterium]|nr:pyridoxamine 5'-phosphate oxidase family protein [Deltaproteobacteria bacterium]